MKTTLAILTLLLLAIPSAGAAQELTLRVGPGSDLVHSNSLFEVDNGDLTIGSTVLLSPQRSGRTRLILLSGFWSRISDNQRFNPDSRLRYFIVLVGAGVRVHLSSDPRPKRGLLLEMAPTLNYAWVPTNGDPYGGPEPNPPLYLIGPEEHLLLGTMVSAVGYVPTGDRFPLQVGLTLLWTEAMDPKNRVLTNYLTGFKLMALQLGVSF